MIHFFAILFILIILGLILLIASIAIKAALILRWLIAFGITIFFLIGLVALISNDKEKNQSRSILSNNLAQKE